MVVVKAHLSEARHLDFDFLYHLGPRALARAPTLAGQRMGLLFVYSVRSKQDSRGPRGGEGQPPWRLHPPGQLREGRLWARAC